MDKKEVLEKVGKKKAVVGEMEKNKMFAGNYIALIIAGIAAVVFICFECWRAHFTGAFAIGAICYLWACVQYVCQYVMAHRPWQVLFGAVLDGLAAVACITFYVLFSVGVL